MRRDTQNVLLVLLGGALVRIAGADLYLRYVKPSHRWLLLGAGAVIVLLAMTAMIRDLRESSKARRMSGGSYIDHGHREPHSPWLLLLPVLAVFLVSPPALGADSVTGSPSGGAIGSQPANEFPPLPPGDAPTLGISDFIARAIWDRSGSLRNREVTLTGFLVRRAGAVELARLRITCCAADARPAVIELAGRTVSLPSDTWVQVRGTLVDGTATPADDYRPTITVASLTVITTPVDPYEY